MRNDEAFQETQDSTSPAQLTQDVEAAAGSFRGNLGIENGASHSGHEPNNVFHSQQGRQFSDVSGLSGFDHTGDGRSLAVWDYDRDGRSDLAVVNANRPLLQVFRNQTLPRTAENGFLAVRLVGGNDTDQPAPDLSPRDGYGARIELTLGEQRRIRELRGGEGLGAQNSSTLLLGLGKHRQVDKLRVIWPSGREQVFGPLSVNRLVTIHERPRDGSQIEVADYASAVTKSEARSSSDNLQTFEWAQSVELSAGLNLFVTMATWCPSCRRELPQLQRLRGTFDSDELGMFGIPIDETEDVSKLQAYAKKFRPAYQLMTTFPPPERIAVGEWLESTLQVTALPSSVVTDAKGRILAVMVGIPTLSEMRRLLAEEDSGAN